MRRQILNYCADQTNQDQEAKQHKLLQSAFPKISASLYLNIESNQISHLPFIMTTVTKPLKCWISTTNAHLHS
jgi:hypothetical protein